jgi:hypothetical protein
MHVASLVRPLQASHRLLITSSDEMWSNNNYICCRFAAYIMTPNLRISQLICSVGYSFYSWSLALVLTIVFDWFYESGLLIHPTIPLIAVGMPSAAMQVSQCFH